MNFICKGLSIELMNTSSGDTWYWSNFNEAVKDVTSSQATIKVAGFPNSIAEIVWHMTQWKIFCIRKLEMDESFDIQVNSDKDWRRFSSLTDDEWATIKEGCMESTSKLASQITMFKDDLLFDRVPGRSYQFFKLIIGVIEHEVLHASQVSYLKRFIQESNSK